MNVRLAVAALCLLPASVLLAQQPAAPAASSNSSNSQTPPPRGGYYGRPMMGRDGAGGRDGRSGGGRERGFAMRGGMRGPMGEGMHEGMRGGMMHVGFAMPHGAWWKDTALATRVGLSADQVKRLDDLSLQSRLDAVRMHATIEEDQLRLEPLVTGANFDEKRAEAAMDKLADERAALEKAEAKSMLGMRAVLTPDQWTKLTADERGRFHGGPEGPGSERGPHGGGRPGGPPPAPTE